MTIEIRQAVVADVDVLASLARRTFLLAYAENETPEHVHDYVERAFESNKITDEVTTPGNRWIMMLVDGCAAGYVKIVFERPIDELADAAPAQLERIYLLPEYQGGGLGRRLLDAALDEASASGARNIWLAVWIENISAQRFYASAGFEPIGRTHFMLGPERQEDRVMSRKLT